MTNKLLLKMIDVFIKILQENNICSYCRINHDRDYRCDNDDYCADLIFDGVKLLAQKEMEEND